MSSPPAPRKASLREPIAGGMIWITYFALVYLVAEAACELGSPDFRLFGMSGVALITLAATFLALGAIAIFTHRAWRRWATARGDADVAEQSRMLGLVGVILGSVFSIATVAVAVPVLVVAPC